MCLIEFENVTTELSFAKALNILKSKFDVFSNPTKAMPAAQSRRKRNFWFVWLDRERFFLIPGEIRYKTMSTIKIFRNLRNFPFENFLRQARVLWIFNKIQTEKWRRHHRPLSPTAGLQHFRPPHTAFQYLFKKITKIRQLRPASLLRHFQRTRFLWNMVPIVCLVPSDVEKNQGPQR